MPTVIWCVFVLIGRICAVINAYNMHSTHDWEPMRQILWWYVYQNRQSPESCWHTTDRTLFIRCRMSDRCRTDVSTLLMRLSTLHAHVRRRRRTTKHADASKKINALKSRERRVEKGEKERERDRASEILFPFEVFGYAWLYRWRRAPAHAHKPSLTLIVINQDCGRSGGGNGQC